MKRLSLTLRIFALTMFTLALCAAAQAQNTHSWVSAEDGNDANPCTRLSPCLTFAGAALKTNPRGQISALDSGNYGSLVIDKALTIDGGTGNVATIDIAVGIGITVNAATADTVVLRNLTINGHDTANTGISYVGGGQLFMENLTIERFTGFGIFAEGTSAANPLRAEMNKSRLIGNLIGIQLEDHTQFALRDSVITGTLHKGPPNSFGINMQPSPGTIASLKIESNEISYTQSGLRAVGNDVGGGDPTWWGRNNHFYGNTIGVNMTTNVTYHSAGGNLLSENPFPFFGGVNAGVPSL